MILILQSVQFTDIRKFVKRSCCHVRLAITLAVIQVGESLRGNRIGATGLRASERKSASERVSEREGFQRFLRGFEKFLAGIQRF